MNPEMILELMHQQPMKISSTDNFINQAIDAVTVITRNVQIYRKIQNEQKR